MYLSQRGGGGVHKGPIPANTIIAPMLMECWASVEDGGPIFRQHWGNVSCLLGCIHVWTASHSLFVDETIRVSRTSRAVPSTLSFPAHSCTCDPTSGPDGCVVLAPQSQPRGRSRRVPSGTVHNVLYQDKPYLNKGGLRIS